MLTLILPSSYSFFFNDTATTEIYTLSLHDALPIFDDVFNRGPGILLGDGFGVLGGDTLYAQADEILAVEIGEACGFHRSEEHTSELQSPDHIVCRLLLQKKTNNSTHSVLSPPSQHH